jgi:hypothetical protein
MMYKEYITVTTDNFVLRIFCNKLPYVVQVQLSYLMEGI